MIPGKRFILNLLRGRGYYVQPSDWLSLGTHLPTDLKKLGWKASDRRVIFDVGANIGNFTNELKHYFPHIEAHCFEANPNIFETLQSRLIYDNVFLNNVGLGKASGFLDLTVGPSSEYSSFVPTDRLKKESVGLLSVPVTSCDEYCSQNGIETIDLLKIDVEGFEIDVLDGARANLKSTKIVMCEARFGPHEYPGVQISELIEYLTPYDFHFLSLFNGTKSGAIKYNYGDALFVNQSLAL